MSPAPRSGARPSPFVGRTLGRCVIRKPIGRGGTATVFHATYEPLKKDVAVKILRAGAGTAPEAKTRFVEEARALAKLHHPNVVRVFDVVEDQGLLLIIMDFVEGRNLLEAIEEDGPMDPAEAVDAARQVALALDHAHGQKILHRDVKPANVIVNDAGEAVLVDFGNAEVVGEAADRKGTAHYVAPEVFQGKRQDEKCDTYSLGATLFHMLTGRPPFEGQSVKDILKAHEAGKLRAPSQVNPEGDIPKEIDALVKRAMAPARGYRFAARDMAAALAEAGAAVERPTRRRAAPRREREGRRPAGARRSGASPAMVMSILLGIVVVGVAVAFAISGSGKPVEEGPRKPTTEAPKPLEDLPAAEEKKAPADFGIKDRAAAREARKAEAEKAFAQAKELALSAGDRPKEVAAKYAAVAKEYGDLEVGRQSAEEAKFWNDRALTETDRAARRAAIEAEKAAERKAREDALGKVREHVGGMRFAEALGALQEIEAPEAEAEAWRRRGERLNVLIGFAEALGESIRGQPVDAYAIRASFAKPGEKVVDASEVGVVLKSATGESRTVSWTDVKPPEVVALGRKCLRQAPEPRLTLACYAMEAGLKDDAAKELDIARLTDRVGFVGARADELFGSDLE
jgi:tRNA A-37 threonylcarbamoyl transferase component Bud32